jgi:hypothetical protein
MKPIYIIFKIAKTTQINYKQQRVLDHILTKNSRLPDPSLTKAITSLVKRIQSLLGLAQVAHEYIPALATLIEPIQRLSKKGIDIEKE